MVDRPSCHCHRNKKFIQKAAHERTPPHQSRNRDHTKPYIQARLENPTICRTDIPNLAQLFPTDCDHHHTFSNSSRGTEELPKAGSARMDPSLRAHSEAK